MICRVVLLLLFPLLAFAQTEEELEALRALPYAHWTNSAANTKLTGVTIWDPKKAFNGYSFYTNDQDEAYLIDMAGKRVHTWRFEGKKKCETAKLLDNGDVVAVCIRGGLIRVDRNSRVVWDNGLSVHHDVAPLPDGRFLAWSNSVATYRQFSVVFDSLLHISESGKVMSDWSTFENHEELRKTHRPVPLDTLDSVDELKRLGGTLAFDYYHMNTIETLPENALYPKDRRFRPGNFLICSRNTDLVAIIDKVSKKVLWHWGPGELEGPHTPSMTSNGNLMIFDNGTRRKYSRVIEVNPITYKIVWEFKATPPERFFCPFRGAVQRLPNGNTLISNSEDGHAFEVTRDGKIVWDFWNPQFRRDKRKTFNRFVRVAPEQVKSWLRTK